MAHRSQPLIALLTDFGTRDWYVACLKAVILSIAPRARLVDITHEIPPQDIVAGAVILSAAAPSFPLGTIFACVVDPGVGTSRPLIAARADRASFVGPDNGIFGEVFRRSQRLDMVRLTNSHYWLPTVSQTFHGRDIVAPVAARLALGCPLQQLGRPHARYHPVELPSLRRSPQAVRGSIVFIDVFGNLITNLPASLMAQRAGWRVRYKRRLVRVVSSYEEGRSGELTAIVGSTGYLELAVRRDSAAVRYRAKRGDRVEWCRG